MDKINIDELATFCKRKGFVYPSGEIYGGLAGFWDYGPLGVEIKNNIKQLWWKSYVHSREDMAGIDGAIITNPKVWEASGHVSNFIDFAIRNKKTKEKFKVDKNELDDYKDNPDFEILGEFNPMFTTQIGPAISDSTLAYLRPETAQLIFADFKQIQENSRMKLPFGIAQIGKSFRNEISPREFLFRCREFEQMEIEYFISPNMKCPYMDEIKSSKTPKIKVLSAEMQESNQEPKEMDLFESWDSGIIKRDWHAYWISLGFNWFISLGARPEKFRIRQHGKEERSHYSSDTWDLEYEFPMGWRELQGFADRSNYDLTQHEKHSKKSMSITDPEAGKVLPEVVCEPSLGLERAFLIFLLDAYTYDSERENIVLKLNPKIAPYKAAIFPLVSKGEIFDLSREIYKDLLKEFPIFFDKSGSIGRRYARQDESGTPFCITVDGDSLEDNSVTIRDRNTTKQVRVKISELKNILRKLISAEISFKDLK